MDHHMTELCRGLKDQLSAYLDGELEAALCAQIEEHLQGCDNCRVVIDTLNKTITLYREAGPADVPPETHDRLSRVLHLEMLRQAESAQKDDRARELERRIADLKSRWPKHSVPRAMQEELDELEEELVRLRGG